MQARAALPLAVVATLLAALVAAGPALAQTPQKKRVLPPPKPAVEAAPAAKPAGPPPPLAPPLRLGGPVGLVGMSPVGDPAPACRAQCSKDRYVCHAAGDPTDCDSRWIPCLQACSAH